MAHELGKTLNELMGWEGPLSALQLDVWSEWLHQQLNVPSRTDYHLMRVAYEARFCMTSEKPSVNLRENFGVTFKTNESKNYSQEEIDAFEAEQAERSMCAGLGLVYGQSYDGEKPIDGVDPLLGQIYGQ